MSEDTTAASKLIDIEQALAIVLDHVQFLTTEKTSLSQALFRTLAEPVSTDIDQPPFDRSLMDGYAVRAVDIQSPPATLQIVGQIAAGLMPQTEVGPGQAMQINTGAPIPCGADAVIPVERTQAEESGEAVLILDSAKPGKSITRRGTYKKARDVVLSPGSLLTPVNVGVCASAGAAEVEVYRRPRVAVIVTGDELVEVNERPIGAQIRNSNRYILETLIRSVHCEPFLQASTRDNPHQIKQAVSDSMDCNVICLTGGVSMGAFDFVPGVLKELGATIHFHKISIKPGRPALFATMPAGQLVFALPGNPVSALVGFGLLVAPALAALQGRQEIPPLLQAELNGSLPAEGSRRAYYPASLSVSADGGYIAQLLSWHGSGDALGLAGAQGFIVRPEGSPAARNGEAVRILLL